MEIISSNIQKIKNEFCDLQLEFQPYFRDMKKISDKLKKNFEITSSRIRRKHVELIYKNNPDSVVVTGHNMSDWFETLILRMNRGASLEKLYPFLPNELFQNINYFRPLVLSTHNEVRQICKLDSLEYWDDPSNFNGSNMRSKIRNFLQIENPDGFRLTTHNYFKAKQEYHKHIDAICDQLNENIWIISPGREYRVEGNYFKNLGCDEKNILTEIILQNLKFWPVSSTLKNAMNNIPFYYKVWSIEKENWSGSPYITFRRGCNRLMFDHLHSFDTDKYSIIMANETGKKHYIQMPYGKKMVKKIFSEKQLSNRQRKSLPLVFDKKKPFEITNIPLSIFGLNDINCKFSNKGKEE
jgi:tRNA(Ile)-lysidine synthase TilS/MesJ